MTRKRSVAALLTLCAVVLAGGAVCFHAFGRVAAPTGQCAAAGRRPRISPDYVGTTIPPNVAPLNFRIEEPGAGYCARIHAGRGGTIEVVGKAPAISIPPDEWRELLSANRGGPLFLDVYVMAEGGKWTRYERITNHIAGEEIDGYLAYRLLKPVYNFWTGVGIYQRNLATWDESVVFHGRSFANGCVNCHTFRNNSPEQMFVGMRSTKYGSATLLAAEGKVERIGAKWGYTAWHPNGRIAVYAIMKVRQFVHRAGMELRDVVDLDAALLYYDLETRTVRTTPGMSDDQRLETYPTWSPDGRYLYFCSAPIPWRDRNALPPKHYEDVRYDLRRIRYYEEKGTWGRPETVLSTDKSILLPRISPNGQFLLFCMCDYGCFPIFRPSSDLYIMDPETREYEEVPVNSEFSESWHSWSSNSRWIVFSSKRRGGLFTRLYISYVDAAGKAHKPFLLPQRNPEFYDSCLNTYSVPELITGPVKMPHRALVRAARSPRAISTADPITGATPKAAPAKASDPYLQPQQ